MTPDFEFLEKNYENKQALVTYMFDHYKRLIYKKGIVFTRSLRNKVEVDDFVSDVYEKLFFYANYIKLEKVDSEKFMFYIYVHHACCDIYTKLIKSLESESCLSLDDEDSSLSATYNDSIAFNLQYKEFMKQLTATQRQVLNLRLEGKTIVDIQKILNLSYYLVSKELNAIKLVFASTI